DSGSARYPHPGTDGRHDAHDGGLSHRKADDELRPLAVAAADGDAAAEQLGELLRDTEPEARATVPGGRLGIDLLEIGGECRPVRLPDADAGVSDEDEDAASVGRAPAVRRIVDEGKPVRHSTP